MKQTMNIRMNFIRAANSDSRLTPRQRLFLSTLMTFMPFDSEEGWVLETTVLAESYYRSTDKISIKNTRTVLRELEDLGALERVYPGSPKSRYSDPTFFINWEWVLAPLRKAKQTPQPGLSEGSADTLDQVQQTPQPGSHTYIRTQSTRSAGGEAPRLKVVQ